MNRLYMEKIVSVGAVPEGDDPEALITFYKSKDSTLVEGTENPHRVNDDEGANMSFDLSALDDEVRKAVEDHIASEVERIVAEREPEAPAAEEAVDVLKGAPDEVRELVAKQAEQIEELAKTLAEQERQRRDQEFIAKATQYEVLLGKADEVGPVLRELADASPEAWAALEGMLTAAAQREDLGEVFKEYGTNQMSDPQAVVDAYVKKAKAEDPKRNVSDIRAEFYAANPDVVRALREVT